MVSWNVRMPNTTKPESFASLESLTDVLTTIQTLTLIHKSWRLSHELRVFVCLNQLCYRLLYIPAFYTSCFTIDCLDTVLG
jgi:hypothetical protein